MIRSFGGATPRCGVGVFVDPSAQVVGDVELDADASVWMNAVVRGDVHRIRIGRASNVQDGCVLHVARGRHPLLAGSHVTFGHGVIAHGCTIGDRVLLGIGCRVLDGAMIGQDSIVAAGAVVTEGAVVPPRSLVLGLPAKVRRTLTPEEIESIMEYARNYVGYKERYMRELERDAR